MAEKKGTTKEELPKTTKLDYREETRKSWSRVNIDKNYIFTKEEFMMGNMFRIADALESIANSFRKLSTEMVDAKVKLSRANSKIRTLKKLLKEQ